MAKFTEVTLRNPGFLFILILKLISLNICNTVQSVDGLMNVGIVALLQYSFVQIFNSLLCDDFAVLRVPNFVRDTTTLLENK